MKPPQSAIIALAISLALLVPMSVVGQESSPSATEAETAESQATGSESVAGAVEWTKMADLPGAKKGQFPIGMDVGPDGAVFLLAGTVGNSFPRLVDYRLWRTVNGQTWERVSLPKANKKTFVDAIDASPVGVAVVGHTPLNKVGRGLDPLLWLSKDGVEWDDPVKVKGAFLSDVTFGPEGLVAVGDGRSRKNISPSVWQSNDGKKWKLTKLTKNEGPSPWLVAASLDGIILVVGIDAFKNKTVMWRSVDGSKFKKVPVPEGVPHDLVATPAGFLLASNQDGVVTVSSSPDGTVWSPVASGDGVNARLGPTDDGVVAVVSPLGEAATALTSPDGYEWQRLEVPVGEGEDTFLGAARVGDGLVIAYGWAGSDFFASRLVTWSGLTQEQSVGDAPSDEGPPPDEG